MVRLLHLPRGGPAGQESAFLPPCLWGRPLGQSTCVPEELVSRPGRPLTPL